MSDDLHHKDCGGRIVDNWDDPYRFEGEDARVFGAIVPRHLCEVCGAEILGDADIAESLDDIQFGRSEP